MKTKELLMIAVVMFAAVFLFGCGAFSRVVYVSDGQAVRLRETVKKVRVWVKTDTGVEPGVADLQEGMFCLPDTEE